MTTLPDFFDANMALLKELHPVVWQFITETSPQPVGKIEKAANGNLNLTIIKEGKEHLLHNEQGPSLEADDYLKKIDEEDTGFLAILGMGLGYAPIAILKKRPLLQYLAVFERDPAIFMQALHHIDLSSFLKNPRLILGVGSNINLEETLAIASRTIRLESSRIFYHQRSFRLTPKEYEDLHDKIYAHLSAFNIEGNTTMILGKNFLSNRFNHITTIHHDMLLEQLKNKFEGIPAILVAGGPSLDKNIHLLAQAQEKAVIFAVDTVFPTLLKYGIQPHFLASIDPNNLTYEKFADVASNAKEVNLICASWVNLKTAKMFPAEQTFWTFTHNHMEAWLNKLLGGQIFSSGASTVAHLNFAAAHTLGCDPIIFIGQDLAFAGSASHANGTVLQGINPTKISQDGERYQTVPGVNGDMVYTNRAFLSMKRHFENAIAQHNKTYINSSEGGAHIEGATDMQLVETLEKFCSEPYNIHQTIREYKKELKPIDPTLLLKEFKKTNNSIKNLRQDISKLDKICTKMISDLSKLQRQSVPPQDYGMLPTYIHKKIDTIDKINKKLDRDNLWKLLEEITMDGLKNSERKKQALTLLKDDPNTYCQWLSENLKRFLEIDEVRKQTLKTLDEQLNKVLSFHKEEGRYLQNIAAGKEPYQNRLRLLRLYLNTGNIKLANPIAEKLHEEAPESAEVAFDLGRIAALHADHEKADSYFEKAKELDPEFTPKVEELSFDLADEFLRYTEYFKTQPGRHLSVKYMLRKGLKYDPNNEKLLAEQLEALRVDLKTIQDFLDNNNPQEAAPLINEWYDQFQHDESLSNSLPPRESSQIIANYGTFLLSENRHAEALTCFRKAMNYTPNATDLHTKLIDTLFAIGNFNDAIEALNKAIAIDKEFAAYWEIIGDSLAADGQHDDAIIAYENCFKSLPKNLGLLKKIGDCYRATNQLEAAHTAYQELKNRMEKLETASDDVN